jgi:hypothetical protein
MQNQWILGNPLAGVRFSMNQRVRVTAGPDAGAVGVLISIYEIGSDPGFQMETDDGRDLCVHQTELVALDS